MGANDMSAEILPFNRAFNRALNSIPAQRDFDDLAMDHADPAQCEYVPAEVFAAESFQANAGMAGSSPAISDNAQDHH
jgi:hypothetical protein